jgi:2'-5' RNA ligase
MEQETAPTPAEPVRAFIAVALSPDAHAFLQRVQIRLRRVGADVRWTPPGSLHLTLAFLGDVPLGRIEPLAAELDVAAASCPVFHLGIGELGAFGAPARPRVIWAGVTGDVAALSRLAEAARAAALRQAIRPDEKSFVPHITLGRVKSSRRASELAAAMAKPVTGTPPGFLVHDLRLMRSRLTPQGAVHSLLHAIRLAGA